MNIDDVKGRIDHILSGDLDYHHISHVEEELIEVCEIGETLQKESNFYNAAEVHLIVAEGVVEAFELGADDSGGYLGGIAHECVESFCLCTQEMNKEQAMTFLARTIHLSIEEDYGLETGHMVIALANNSNLNTIETLVKKYIKDLDERVRDHSSFSYSYNRRKMKELLSEVYSKLGMKERAMDILLYDIRTREEYVHVAKALMHEKRYAEALDMLRRASKGHNVNSTYFQVLDKMPKKEIKMHWNTPEAVEFAFLDPGPLSRYIERDGYNSIRDIFLKAGAVDEMVAEAQCIIPGTEVLATLFLYECESEKAASVFKKNARISGRTGMCIGSMAWKQRKKDLAMEVTQLALKRGVDLQNVEDTAECKKIIEELLKRTPKNDIQGLVDSFKMNRFLLMFVAEKLVHIRPDIARTLIEKNSEQLEGDFIVRMIKILGRKVPKEGLRLGVNAFNVFSNRSHIYYDVMIDMLKAVRPYYSKVQGEKGWNEYLDSLRAKFKTRKKLMKMIDGMEKKPSSKKT